MRKSEAKTEYRFETSRKLFEQAQHYMAGGVSSHFRSLEKPHPLFFRGGCGARIQDVDGNEYLDFALSQGPLLLGHSHPEVLARVREELAKGQLYGGQSEIEIDLARKLIEIIPGVDLVRFCNSGSDAVHTAIRLARAVTGKRKIVKFEGHYHGWYDNVFVDVRFQAERDRWDPVALSRGQLPSVKDEVTVIPWNDLNVVQQTLERDLDIAVLILEPVMCNTSCIMPKPGYLKGLHELCHRFNVVPVFDEVITGFRLAPGGAQEYFGIIPDLATYGKAMGSGFPISVLAGKREYMELLGDGQVIHAGTFNANISSVAAALATLEILTRNEGEVYSRITRLGQRLIEGLRKRVGSSNPPLLVQGPGPVFHTDFSSMASVTDFRQCTGYDGKKLDKFVVGLLRRGIRILGRGLWYISAAHTAQDVEMALECADQVLCEIEDTSL